MNEIFVCFLSCVKLFANSMRAASDQTSKLPSNKLSSIDQECSVLVGCIGCSNCSVDYVLSRACLVYKEL